MRTFDYKKQFSKDLKKLEKSGRVDIKELSQLLNQIASSKPLDRKYGDHPLSKHSPKEYQGCRDFHYKPNICVVYRINDNVLELLRIGNHSDLGLTESFK